MAERGPVGSSESIHLITAATREDSSQNPVQRFSLSDLNPIDAAKNLAEKAWGAISSLGSSAWNTAKELGSSTWNAAKNAGSAAWDGIRGAGSSVWNTVENLGTKAWDAAKGLGGRAWSLVQDTGSRALNWAKSAGQAAWNSATSLGNQAWNWAKNTGVSVWNSAKSFGGQLWNSAKSWGSRAWNGIKSGVNKAWGGINALGNKVWQTVKSAANSVWEQAKQWGEKAWNTAKSLAGKLSVDNLCKAVGALAEKAYDFLAPYVSKAWDTVKKLGEKAWESAKQWASKLWDSAKSAVAKVEALAKQALDKAVSAVKDLAGKAWNRAKQLGTKLLNGAKQLGSKAWTFAKSLGTKAWEGAKGLADKLWSQAKAWGSKAIDEAKRLGAAAWDTAKALGTKIVDNAKAAANNLLSLADKLTGGAASKVGELANQILNKAAGLLSWVLSKARELADRALQTAKDWAGKALQTAKDWGSKLWDTAKSAGEKAWNLAKSLAEKAWDSAKQLAEKAWGAAKSWGSQAIATAKDWAGKAWDKAKELAGSAWDTAKGWAGKAWDWTKSAASKAWSSVKSYAAKAWDGVKGLGSKAWAFAKSVGAKAADWAKKLGLDKAWGWIKDKGSKALALARKARQALINRIQKMIALAKRAGPYLLKILMTGSVVGLPIAAIGAALKFVACVTGGAAISFEALVEKVLKFAPVLRSIADAVKNPEAAMMPLVSGVAGKLEREMPAKALDTGRQRLDQLGGRPKAAGVSTPATKVMRSPVPSAVGTKTDTSKQRTTASLGEIWNGFVRQIKAKWASLNVWQMVKDMFWTLLWPWPAIGREVSGLWSDVRSTFGSLFAIRNVLDDPLGALHDLWTNFLHLLDVPLVVWRRLNNILMSLMGWVTIALVILGAVGGSFAGTVIGGILAALPTLGAAAPEGGAAGAGAGGLAGAGAGWAASMAIGEVLLVSFVGAELTNIAKKLTDLTTGELTSNEKEEDYSGIADSLIGLGVTAVLVLIGWIASRLAAMIKGAIARIRGPRTDVPDVKPPDIDPATGKRIVAEEPIEGGGKVEVTEDGSCLVCASPCPDIAEVKAKYSDILGDPDPVYEPIRAKLAAAEAIDGTLDPDGKAKAVADAVKDLKEAAARPEFRIRAMQKATADALDAIRKAKEELRGEDVRKLRDDPITEPDTRTELSKLEGQVDDLKRQFDILDKEAEKAADAAKDPDLAELAAKDADDIRKRAETLSQKAEEIHEATQKKLEEYQEKLRQLEARKKAALQEADDAMAKSNNICDQTEPQKRGPGQAGDGSLEAAVESEAETGKRVKDQAAPTGHWTKIKESITGLQNAIRDLQDARPWIDDVAKRKSVDETIARANERLSKLRSGWNEWEQRVENHPDKWNPDGTSKVDPGFPVE
jgi:phage-related protein